MSDTTAVIQDYLRDLKEAGDDSAAEPIIRALLAEACNRLCMLCRARLLRSYPRLAHPPQNLEVEELLGAAVERLIKALRLVRPETPRKFFALANQHIRWELNDLARRLDERPALAEFLDAPAPAESDSGLAPNASMILDAIDKLPDDEREAFELVRIQGMSNAEVAEIAGVSVKTIQRRLSRALLKLAENLSDLNPGGREAGQSDI